MEDDALYSTPYWPSYGSYRPSRGYYYKPAATAKQQPAAPKVVNIPVQFVESERSGTGSEFKLDSASKIQRVFRGYRVRKSVKRIAAIGAEVDEVERKIREEGTVELIRRDTKERLKVSEALMSLLLKLDSVCGVDPGVRELRKAVIKRVIALQEFVDSILSAAEAEVAGAEEAGKEFCTVHEDQEVDSGPRASESHAYCDSVDKEDFEVVDQVPEASQNNVVDSNPEEEECQEEEEEKGCEEETPCLESSQEDSSGNLIEGEGESTPEEKANVVEDEEEEEEEEEKGRGEDEEVEEGSEEERKKSREILERMMKDNERMMGMMAELVQRNEVQIRLLSSLSQRVDQLEKAFLCERLRRKNKAAAKRNAGGCGDCIDSSDQYHKKCEKR